MLHTRTMNWITFSLISVGLVHSTLAGCKEELMKDRDVMLCMRKYTDYIVQVTSGGGDIMAAFCSTEGRNAMQCVLEYMRDCPELMAESGGGSIPSEDQLEMACAIIGPGPVETTTTETAPTTTVLPTTTPVPKKKSKGKKKMGSDISKEVKEAKLEHLKEQKETKSLKRTLMKEQILTLKAQKSYYDAITDTIKKKGTLGLLEILAAPSQ